jgi:serine phosphatase RsbU (regulator of sigma subunit)/CHASE2 domain-containing sensor protein
VLRLLIDPRMRLIVVAGIGAALAVLGFQYHWFNALDLMVCDMGLSVRPAVQTESDVIVVAIDLHSRRTAFRPPEFPISAHVDEHAEVIRLLHDAGASIIAMDILFDQLDPNLDLSRFVQTLKDAGPVCLASAIEERTLALRSDGSAITEEHLVLPGERIPPGTYCVGLVNMPVDGDLAVRRSAYGRIFQDEWLPSMPVVLASSLLDGKIPYLDDSSSFHIDYRMVADGITTIPYADILSGDGWEPLVKGRAVLIGVTENSLSDIYDLPLRGLPATEHGNRLPGVLILAYAAQTLIGGRVLDWFPPVGSLLLGIGLAFAAGFTALGRRLALNTVLAVAMIIGLATAGILLVALRVTMLPVGLFIGVVFFTAVVGLGLNYVRTRFISEVQEKELEEISSDLKKAAAIQQHLQPESLPRLEGFELAGFQVPCKDIGGDYYDAVELGDGKMGLLIADVCGKGVAAALLMSNLQSNFRQLATAMRSPKVLVTDLNAIASQVFSEGRFVTLLYAVLDTETKRLSYCSAGHMPPLIARHDGSVIELEPGGLPIGLFPDFEWDEHDFQLQRGDLVFMYTDGLSEAARPGTEELYGTDRVRAYLEANRSMAADEFNKAIVAEARRFSRSEHLDDDITLLTLRVL